MFDRCLMACYNHIEMCFDNVDEKRQYEPRTKKIGPYKQTNSYTQTFSWQQISTLMIFVTQMALHSIFIVPTLDDIKIQILWILLGFHYSLLLVIGYDYIILTTFDPVDRLVTNTELAGRFRQDELTFCNVCDCYTLDKSKHCNKCNRCTEEFDHHCRFLNNCIGGLNYQPFFRLLCIYTLYNFNIIGQSVWVLRQNLDRPGIAFEGNQWGVLALLVITVLIELSVGGLLIFHIYISVWQMTTTFKYNYPEKKSHYNSSPIPKIKIVNVAQTPQSARQFVNNQRKHVV